MKIVPVKLGDRSYKILIGSNNFGLFEKELMRVLPNQKIIILTNRTISNLYKNKIDKILKKKFDLTWLIIPDGERFKNLKTIENIYNRLIKNKANRSTGLIALGGGVVGDIGGFAASSYLRGIPYIQVPTTLLAQVDSSVGGKTGVDLPCGKNLVGSFYQPRLVFIDTHFLKTLPHREFLCGISEIVKYGVLWDKNLFEFIEKHRDKILNLDHQALIKIIGRSCEIKASIVSQDEKETGLRSLLNLGHTLGHAIETLSGYRSIRHGEAISQGMVFAAHLSWMNHLCPLADKKRIENLLKQLGLPVKWPPYSKSDYQKVLTLDKKSQGKKINYIAIKKIGRAIILPLSAKEIVQFL